MKRGVGKHSLHCSDLTLIFIFLTLLCSLGCQSYTENEDIKRNDIRVDLHDYKQPSLMPLQIWMTIENQWIEKSRKEKFHLS